MKKLSKTGVAFALFYILLSITILIYAKTIEDPKGRFVLFQLPLVPAASLLFKLGLIKYFTKFSWLIAYIILGIPTVISFYAFGYICEICVKKLIIFTKEKNN
nr:hypothetical protein [uncultured Desulfobulbus sp.]